MYPVSIGHRLVIPKRYIQSIFELEKKEYAELITVIAQTRDSLTGLHSTTDFNIGINDGPLAGQTVSHAHMHIIPRYKDDCEDPRGGIRWILPGKAKYWK